MATTVAGRAPNHAAETAATSLFNRKLAFLSEKLAWSPLLVEWDAAEADLGRLLAAQAEVESQVSQTKTLLADAELIACQSVEGKNDQERKVNRAVALKNDPLYQAMAETLSQREGEAATVALDVDTVKRRLKRIEMEIRLKEETLRFLGS